MVINIGRQLAAGGREIGKILADNLDLMYCDREILLAAANNSGISEEQFEKADEIENRLLYAFGNNNIQLFQWQSDTIRDLAEKHNCLFLGRCADYILRDRNDCINIFLSANLEDRIKRVQERRQVTEHEAVEILKQADKRRAEYYNFFTNKTWGAAASYDLCINTSILGIDKTAELILKFIAKK